MTNKNQQKNSTDIKISILAKSFLENEKLTTDEICTLLNLNSRTSVNTHIKTLKNLGANITSQKINKRSYYIIDSEDVNSINILELLSYSPINEDILRKYAIIQELQNGPITRKEFKNHFVLLNQTNEMTYFDKLVPLDIRQTYFYRLLNEQLVEKENEIYLDSQNEKYYLTGNTIPLLITLNDYAFLEIYDNLSTISPGNPYYKNLKSVSNKLSLMHSAADKTQIIDDTYLVYGKQPTEYCKINTYLSKIKAYDYKNKVLNIKYQTKNKEILILPIAVGLIVYSVEKDSLYLIGNISNNNINDSQQSVIIIVNSIISIEETSLNNTIYNSEYFQTLYNEMLCVSVEPAIDIVIEFDNIFLIPRRIEYLHKQRPLSSLVTDKQRNVLIYKDRIRGKGDLKEYLRQFGSSARVISPDWLRDEMKESAKRALERYEEINNE